MVGYVPVSFEDIAFFSKDRFTNKEGELEELLENYIWFQNYNGEHYFLYKSLKGVLKELPDYFIRVNGKYIVNILNKKSKIVFGESHITILKRELEVTETYRKNFKNLIKRIYGSRKNH